MYAALQKLSDDYTIYHGIFLHEASAFETDFVIIHPAKGGIVLEVKGGIITRVGHTYYTLPRTEHIPKQTIDPFTQVARCRQRLVNLALESRGTHQLAKTFPFLGAICFPDTNAAEIPLDMSLPPPTIQYPITNIVLTQEDIPLGQLEAKLDAIYQQIPLIGRLIPLDSDGMRRYFSLLHPLNSNHPTQARLFYRDQDHLAIMTQQAMDQLAMMRLYPRWAVVGGPGTGKTVLAYETAAVLSDEGKRVLLLCNNTVQAHWLRGDQHLSILRSQSSPQFHIKCLRELVQACIKHSTLTEQEQTSALKKLTKLAITTHHGQHGMAELLKLALANRPAKGSEEIYDAIIVDEAQALDNAFEAVLPLLLRDREHGRIYVFFDNGQNFDKLETTWQTNYHERSALTANLRNHPRIFALMQTFNNDLHDTPSEVVDPENNKALQEYHLPKTIRNFPAREEWEEAELLKILDQLTGPTGHVVPENILIISCRTQAKSRIYHLNKLGNHRLRQLNRGIQSGEVKVTTVRSARGLESDVVILVELDGLRECADPNKFVFVAISRARNQLHILGGKSALRTTPKRRRAPEPNEDA